MGLFDRFRKDHAERRHAQRAIRLHPRLDGYHEGHLSEGFDEQLQRAVPIDTRIYLSKEALWLLEMGRKELNDWMGYERMGVEKFKLRAGCFAMPSYWATAYSAGYPLEDLAMTVGEYLTQCETKDAIYRKRWPERPDNRIEDLQGIPYAMVLQHLGWLVCLGASQEQIARYLAVTGRPGRDRLFDRIALALGVPREVAEGLLEKRNFQDTLALFDDAREKRQARLVRIMKTWYRTRLADSRGIEPGEPRYTGYWAADVAMLVILLGLDDSACRGMPHYPADLVDYCRAKKNTEPARR